ncbi:MAG: hypothetical protein WC769_10975 [Thermodesulfovibrionales bacterium]|jgi:hypothetical protein
MDILSDYPLLMVSKKVCFQAVIPEVLNRESILFKHLYRPWIPAFAGMTTFYEGFTIH